MEKVGFSTFVERVNQQMLGRHVGHSTSSMLSCPHQAAADAETEHPWLHKGVPLQFPAPKGSSRPGGRGMLLEFRCNLSPRRKKTGRRRGMKIFKRFGFPTADVMFYPHMCRHWNVQKRRDKKTEA